MRRQWVNGRMGWRGGTSYPISTGAPSVDVPDTIPDIFSWYRADLGITLNGSNVSAWADQILPAVDASQGVAGSQPPYIASDAGINGNAIIGPFDGTADHFTAGVASDWSFLHEGTGMTIVMVFRTAALGTLRRLFDNNNGSGTALGLTMQISAASPALAWLNMGNGAAAVLSAPTAASITANSVNYLVFRHATANTPDYSFNLNGVTTTGNNSNTPGTGAAAATLNIGRRSGAVQYFNGDIAEFITYERAISDAEQTQITDYITARYL